MLLPHLEGAPKGIQVYWAAAGKSAVGLGHTFQPLFLLDGIGAGQTLGHIDEIIFQALGKGFDVPGGCHTSLCTAARWPDLHVTAIVSLFIHCSLADVFGFLLF